MAKVNTRAAGVVGGSVLALVAAAAPFVAQWEGLSTDPYVDIAGVLTVCRGETAVPMRRYSEAECDAMFEKSLAKHAGEILKHIPEAAPRSVKLAFISLAYNNGAPAISVSKAAQAAREGDYSRACANFAQWNLVKVRSEREWRACPVPKRRISQSGQRYCVSQGLVNRRAAETRLCLTDLVRG